MATDRSPTLDTLVVVMAVFGVQVLSQVLSLGVTAMLVVAPPLFEPYWSPVTSVYAHASVPHLVGNAVALLVLGAILERATTRIRFHAFFVTTGAISVLAEAAYQQYTGTAVSVLGSSGAVFALLGYLLAANPASERIVGWLDLSPWLQAAIVGTVAGAIAVWVTPPGAALIGHFTGLVLGLLAGRLGLLRPGGGRTPAD